MDNSQPQIIFTRQANNGSALIDALTGKYEAPGYMAGNAFAAIPQNFSASQYPTPSLSSGYSLGCGPQYPNFYPTSNAPPAGNQYQRPTVHHNLNPNAPPYQQHPFTHHNFNVPPPGSAYQCPIPSTATPGYPPPNLFVHSSQAAIAAAAQPIPPFVGNERLDPSLASNGLGSIGSSHPLWKKCDPKNEFTEAFKSFLNHAESRKLYLWQRQQVREFERAVVMKVECITGCALKVKKNWSLDTIPNAATIILLMITYFTDTAPDDSLWYLLRDGHLPKYLVAALVAVGSRLTISQMEAMKLQKGPRSGKSFTKTFGERAINFNLDLPGGPGTKMNIRPFWGLLEYATMFSRDMDALHFGNMPKAVKASLHQDPQARILLPGQIQKEVWDIIEGGIRWKINQYSSISIFCSALEALFEIGIIFMLYSPTVLTTKPDPFEDGLLHLSLVKAILDIWGKAGEHLPLWHMNSASQVMKSLRVFQTSLRYRAESAPKAYLMLAPLFQEAQDNELDDGPFLPPSKSSGE